MAGKARTLYRMAIIQPAIAASLLVGCQDRGADQAYGYRQLLAGAEEEGSLTIYSTTDRHEAAGLIAAFKRRYPHIAIDYRDMPSRSIYNIVIAQANAHQKGADLVWSSAMDLQTKLVNDGYAQSYASPQKRHLPAWAIWKDQAWGTTAEPVVIAYNRNLLPASDVPHSRAELTHLLVSKRESLRGRIATLDPRTSSTGYLFISQDVQISRDTGPLIVSMGRADVKLYPLTTEILDPLADGRVLLAYNIIGSYALERQQQDPSIGVVMPTDHTLVMTRIALILQNAAHPNAAKLFLDFMLSKDGQSELARQYMTPVRDDVAAAPNARAPTSIARALRISPALIANVDVLKRRRFLNRWYALLTGDAPAADRTTSGAKGKDSAGQANQQKD